MGSWSGGEDEAGGCEKERFDKVEARQEIALARDLAIADRRANISIAIRRDVPEHYTSLVGRHCNNRLSDTFSVLSHILRFGLFL
jgi:hypothetical protein